MNFPAFPPPHRHLSLLLGLLLALLGGCAETPRSTDETPTAAVSTVTQPRAWQVEPEVPESDWEPALQTARAALEKLNWMDAETALLPMQSSLLNSYDAQQLAFLRARIAHVRGQEAAALAQLEMLESAVLPPGLDYQVYAFHQQLLHLTGRYLEAARQGVTALAYSNEEERMALKQAVWRDLQRSRTDTVERALASAGDPEWRGWLELALLTREPGAAPRRQLQQGAAAHPAHSAAHPLPGGLEELAQSTGTVDSVALILPLSGRLAAAGRAVESLMSPRIGF